MYILKQMGTQKVQCYQGSLCEGDGYICPICTGQKQTKNETEDPKEVGLGPNRIECVNKFCYLGDMIGAGGGAEEAARNRVLYAWGKFNELAPILTSRGASLKLKGKIYKCVQSVLVHGSETWPMRAEDAHRLERAEYAMVRWMSGVNLRNKMPSVVLRSRLGIEWVMDVVSRGRLRWFGHIVRKGREEWVSA